VKGGAPGHAHFWGSLSGFPAIFRENLQKSWTSRKHRDNLFK
jgi:hypothetical protein